MDNENLKGFIDSLTERIIEEQGAASERADQYLQKDERKYAVEMGKFMECHEILKIIQDMRELFGV